MINFNYFVLLYLFYLFTSFINLFIYLIQLFSFTAKKIIILRNKLKVLIRSFPRFCTLVFTLQNTNKGSIMSCLQTASIEIEMNTVNRPLTYIYSTDLEAFSTPDHFIFGCKVKQVSDHKTSIAYKSIDLLVTVIV